MIIILFICKTNVFLMRTFVYKYTYVIQLNNQVKNLLKATAYVLYVITEEITKTSVL